MSVQNRGGGQWVNSGGQPTELASSTHKLCFKVTLRKTNLKICKHGGPLGIFSVKYNFNL